MGWTRQGCPKGRKVAQHYGGMGDRIPSRQRGTTRARRSNEQRRRRSAAANRKPVRTGNLFELEACSLALARASSEEEAAEPRPLSAAPRVARAASELGARAGARTHPRP